MSGYFQRLIARSMGTGLDVRPLSPQPYANLSYEKLQTGIDELPTNSINTPRSADAAAGVGPAARRKVPPAETTGVIDAIDATDTAAGTSDAPILRRHTNESAVTGGIPGTQTTSAGAMIDPLSDNISGVIPQNPPHVTVNRTPLQGPHVASPEETVAGQAARRAAGEVTEAAEAFHLMPLQSPSLSHNTVSSPAAAPFSSFSPARAKTAVPPQTHLSAARQHRHQSAISESPTIQVTIGRVEIRAAAAPASARKTSARSPAMNLDEYLKQRNGGRR